MKWILLGILVVLVLGVVALVVNAAGGAWWAARFRIRRGKAPALSLPRPRCLPCHGTGWINRDPERTFTFAGDGFEDRHHPATMCPACGGTGRRRAAGPAAGDRTSG